MDKITQSKLEHFTAWTLSIDERIYDWLNGLDEPMRNNTDYSAMSLDIVEEYLYSTFSLQSLNDKSNKFLINGAASYVIKVFDNHWVNSKFVIELDDDSNNLFNLPAIETIPKQGAAFSPYMFIRAIINLKRRGIFRKNLESRIEISK